jgi:hypothetical protein
MKGPIRNHWSHARPENCTYGTALFEQAGFNVVSSEARVFGWPVYLLRKP